MKNVGIVYDPIYSEHDTEMFSSHPERKERVLHTIEVLQDHNMWGKDRGENFKEVKSREADLDEIRWGHSDYLISRVKNTSENSGKSYGSSYLDPDTPVSPRSFNAALYAAGGNFSAIDAIFNGEIERAFCLCRPPGHHANREASRGFCLFNNIVLASDYLFNKKGIKKVAIVDFDAHAGNGTEEIIYNGIPGGDLLMISTHQDPRTLYPGTCFAEDIGEGQQKGKIINIPFAPYSGDQSMKLALDKIILPVLTEFKPEFLLISAGFDGHYKDPITQLGFTRQGFGKILQKLVPISEEFAKNRISVTLEGGYNLDALANSITNVINVMTDGSIIETEDEYDEGNDVLNFTENKLIPKVQSILKPYWKCFQ